MKLSLILEDKLFEARIRQNSPLIDKVLVQNREWLKEFGIDIDNPLKRDEGGVGTAIIYDDKVVKFTSDRSEYGAALRMEEEDIPGLAKVYGTRSIGDIDGDGRTEFLIISERVNTSIPVIYRVAGNILYQYLDETEEYNNIGGIENFKTKSIKEIFDDIIYSKSYSKKSKSQSLKKIILELIKVLKSIYEKTGLVFVDTHGRNIGIKDKNIILFDYGRMFS